MKDIGEHEVVVQVMNGQGGEAKRRFSMEVIVTAWPKIPKAICSAIMVIVGVWASKSRK